MKNKKIVILNKIYKKPISCLTAYSAPIAKILDGKVDFILIGDSVGTVLYGMKNTQEVTLDMMKMHGLAVTKNVSKSKTIIDLPFKTYENKDQALKNVKILLKYTNADFVKLEIDSNKVEIIKHLTDRNINVIAHIGITPQKYKDFSKIKYIGKKENEVKKITKLAQMVESAGAKIILMECISENLAKKITLHSSIPTIGIGASKYCDGQVLVFDDIINLNGNKYVPKFVKKYVDFTKLSSNAVKKFDKEVKSKKFPNKKRAYQ